MTVPSKGDFEAFFAASKWEPEEADRHKSINIDPDHVRAFLIAMTQVKERHRTAAYELPVAKWLFDQPSTARAFKSISRGKKAVSTPNQYVDYLIHVDRATQRINDRCANGHDFQTSLRFEIKVEPVSPVIRGVLTALYGYFHTDRGMLVADSCRDVHKILGDVANAMELILSERDRLAVINEFYLGKHLSVVSPGTLRMLEEALVRIYSVTRNQDLIHAPLRRNDKTARERTLVYDLDKVFRRYYGQEKPTAIFHLMMTEGIETPLDQRTVERLISQWRQERREIRQLKAD